MLALNPEREGWKMLNEMEDYAALKASADVAYARLKALVEGISKYAAELDGDYARAKAPPLDWPRVDQISGA